MGKAKRNTKRVAQVFGDRRDKRRRLDDLAEQIASLLKLEKCEWECPESGNRVWFDLYWMLEGVGQITHAPIAKNVAFSIEPDFTQIILKTVVEVYMFAIQQEGRHRGYN